MSFLDDDEMEETPNGKPSLYVVGTGPFAREMVSWMALEAEDCAYNFRGFLWDNDDDMYKPSPISLDTEDAGSIQEFNPGPSDALIMAYGKPEVKLRLAQLLINKGGRFVSFIHPSAVIGEKACVGEGTIICPNTMLSRSVLVEDFVFVGVGSWIGVGATICRGSTLDARAAIGHHATVEENVSMGVAVTVDANVVIGRDVMLNSGCVVANNISAGAKVLCAPPATFPART